jgi:hypothetical protein
MTPEESEEMDALRREVGRLTIALDLQRQRSLRDVYDRARRIERRRIAAFLRSLADVVPFDATARRRFARERRLLAELADRIESMPPASRAQEPCTQPASDVRVTEEPNVHTRPDPSQPTPGEPAP